MNNIPRFTETNAASHLLIQMPLRVALFSSCFWQTRTLALPRSMFGSAERVLVDIARKKQMPLRVVLFPSCFWQTRTLALPRSMFGSAERVLVDIARKNKCRFASLVFSSCDIIILLSFELIHLKKH